MSGGLTRLKYSLTKAILLTNIRQFYGTNNDENGRLFGKKNIFKYDVVFSYES